MKLPNYKNSLPGLLCLLCLAAPPALAQLAHSPNTYPDEAGFQQRTAGMLQKYASQTFGIRSMATSTCPDTGLPVKTWALEGEEIVSPWTGTRYTQGATGYFGPKARDKKGRISAFGGDPLKYDLPPATASLLLNPQDDRAKAFLSIPGNLNQQYHFAAKNWARFYPLLASKMGEKWQAAFHKAVGDYAEKRRPSDGPAREHAFLSRAHTLTGEPGELLGGNKKDGGTENHKTMWRTSALVYAQHFPEGSQISGLSLAEAEAQTSAVLTDYLARMLQTGNGEYDSQIYYPHSIYGFLNLYDFSTSPRHRRLAQAVLDYYQATYGLKTIDGAIAGAQKRGYLTGTGSNEMRGHLWAWFGTSPGDTPEAERLTSVHQATSSYRPNRVIWNLVHKNVALPFEARMARPAYHMDRPNVFQEYFYADESFAMGNAAMTTVDNPNQQVVWSAVTRSEDGPLSFGGMQPWHLGPDGHSYFTQQVQHKNTLLIMTASGPDDQRHTLPEVNQRWMQQAASLDASLGETALQWVRDATYANSASEAETALKNLAENARTLPQTWLFVPKMVKEMYPFGDDEGLNAMVLDAGKAWLVVSTRGPVELLDVPAAYLPEQPGKGATGKLVKQLQDYRVLVFGGESTVSGYALEIFVKADWPDWQPLAAQMVEKTRLQAPAPGRLQMRYTSLAGNEISLDYQLQGFRANGSINGKKIDWEKWADGAAFQSPYINIKNGKMNVTDGRESYQVQVKNGEARIK